MNAVAFSLYGLGLNYLAGAVHNARLMPDTYPGWKMVVYHDPDIPGGTIGPLKDLGVDLRSTPGCSMFHRFLINDDPKVERYLVRDADSRVNAREAKAVAEWIGGWQCISRHKSENPNAIAQWIDSGRSFHIIRDHPHHPQPMMGGLWGGTTGKISMASLLAGTNINDRAYGADMRFLAQKVWPVIKADALQHDLCTWRQYVGAKPFPAQFGDMRFCGERFTCLPTHGTEEPFKGEWERRVNYMTA